MDPQAQESLYERVAARLESYKVRAVLIAGTSAMLADQFLHAGVMMDLVDREHWDHVAAVVGLSIVAPQVFAWALLKANGMSSWLALPGVLLLPSVGAAVLGHLRFAVDVEPPASLSSSGSFAEHAAIACIPLSAWAAAPLCFGVAAGGEAVKAQWVWLAQGMLEAPVSAALTLYTSLVVSMRTGVCAGPLFMTSFVLSLAIITRTSTYLYFYGSSPTWWNWTRVLCLQKFPQVASQLLGFVLLAFLTRPLRFYQEAPDSSQAWLVLYFVAFEFLLNLGALWTANQKMPTGLSMLFAISMMFGGPPGFLSRLRVFRFGHAFQHLICQVIMVWAAHRCASEEHWEVMLSHHPAWLALYCVTVPHAFIASVSLAPPTFSEWMERAQLRFDEALVARDQITARWLVEVERLPVRAGVVGANTSFVDSFRGVGGSKWGGVVECRGKLFFCPRDAAEVMVMDPVSREVWFTDTGRGEGGSKWSAVVASGGRLFFCPLKAAEIMVMDPVSYGLWFVPTGKREGVAKWNGVVECQGKLFFCPYHAADIMIMDPKSQKVSFVQTGKDKGGAKWSGVVECGGQLFFCPFDSPEIMVMDPLSHTVSFVDCGKGSEVRKWRRMVAHAGKLFLCPLNDAEILIMDPESHQLSFVDTGKGNRREGKWCDVVECDGLLFFCPSNAAEIMVLGASSLEVSFVDSGKCEGGFKWSGLVAFGGQLFFCPSDASEIMILSYQLERFSRCRQLGLLAPM